MNLRACFFQFDDVFATNSTQVWCICLISSSEYGSPTLSIYFLFFCFVLYGRFLYACHMASKSFLVTLEVNAEGFRMGRNSWRRMTLCRGSRKRKSLQLGMGHEFKAGEGDVVQLTDDEINHEIAPEKMDGFGVFEDTLASSKDLIFRDSGGKKKTDIAEAETCDPAISSKNLKSVESGSILSRIPLRASSHEPRPGVIFVFEKASLVLAKVNKSYQIINPDEHTGFMKKHNLDRSDYRPDIIHEILVRLLGSCLNLAGGIQAVYIKTIEGRLIKIEPSLCVPRSLKGFCAMMSQLFQKLSIKGSGRSKCRKLLQIIQNPVTIHLPVGSHKIGLSSTSSKAVNLWEFFDTIVDDRPLVFVIGAMARGKIDSEYTDDFISVSRLPLSASICVRRICNALERQLRIE